MTTMAKRLEDLTEIADDHVGSCIPKKELVEALDEWLALLDKFDNKPVHEFPDEEIGEYYNNQIDDFGKWAHSDYEGVRQFIQWFAGKDRK